VKRGFFFLTGAVVFVLAVSAAGAGQAGFSASEGRGLAVGLALGLAASTLAWLVLMLAGVRSVGRVLGIVTVPVAAAMLYAFARGIDESLALATFQVAAGAAFTGAVLDGLLLGHWYLTDRKLPRGPINRMAWLLIGTVGLEVIALVAGGFGGRTQRTSSSLSPLLFVAGSAAWIAFGMALITGLIAVFIKATLRGTRSSAVQAATGFFYLAVITAFTAELASKVRFLP
jgi:hypothetical protein